MSATKSCYSYDPNTGEFLGETVADLSPLDEEEVWLYPAHTTPQRPPKIPVGKAAVWQGEKWDVAPDHRGEIWWDDRLPVRVIVLGDPTTFDPPLNSKEPEKPIQPPAPISDRQFFQQLAMDGVISEDEALATSDGTMPQLLMNTIAMLPADQQFPAKMMAKNATTFERSNPLVGIIGARLQWDDARLDKLWSDASKL